MIVLSAITPLLFTLPIAVNDDDRLEAIEKKFDALAADLEDLTLAEAGAPLGAGSNQVGPAASKVYSSPEGRLSIGGYGELEYISPNGDSDADAEIDAHRAVFYFGYKFDEKWVFNSEIEIEHVDEIYLEFAYLDYMHSDAMNFRSGVMLTPMGLINEYHEPTTYLGASRPLTEKYVIPTTWREGGVAVYGQNGGFDYQVALMGGMNGNNFNPDKGIRNGRQKAKEALANDLAIVASIDYTDIPGLIVGGSVYSGDSGQDQGNGDMSTGITEFHVDYQTGPWWVRALSAEGSVDDRAAGDYDFDGWYAELAYDLLANDDKRTLYPFIRMEEINTGSKEDTATTFGLHYRPIDNVVFKADVADFDDDEFDDRLMITMGWIF